MCAAARKGAPGAAPWAGRSYVEGRALGRAHAFGRRRIDAEDTCDNSRIIASIRFHVDTGDGIKLALFRHGTCLLDRPRRFRTEAAAMVKAFETIAALVAAGS